MAIETRNGVDGKVCSICDDWKELDEYYVESAKGSSQGQTQNVCISCAKKRAIL